MNTEKYQMKRDRDTIEIDLASVVKTLLRNIWLILAVALICGCAAYMATKLLIAPTYRSNFTAYVNNRSTEENTSLTSSDISAARSLASTYSEILTSRPVLEEAAEAAELELTTEELSSVVSTETVNDTEIIQVNVTMESPQDAVNYANALADIAPTYISKIIEGSSMQIISTPVTPTTIYGPNYKRNTAIGFLLGAFLVMAVAILRDLMDDRVKNVTELEERYGIAVMGSIPDLVAAQKQNYAGYAYEYGKNR